MDGEEDEKKAYFASTNEGILYISDFYHFFCQVYGETKSEIILRELNAQPHPS